MRYLVLLCVLVGGCPLFAQEDVEFTTSAASKDSLREQYIKSYPDHFFIWPVLKQRKLDFDVKTIGGSRRETLGYKANKPFSFGVGMYLFELGFELAFAVPLDQQSIDIYGESKVRDVQLNILGKKWGIDAYYQKYKGYYVDDPATKVPAGLPYPQRGDIASRNLGVSVNYTFNYNKFSFRSSYNFAESQLRSAGSFILFATINAFRAEGDSAIMGQPYFDKFGNAAYIQNIRVTTLGVAPGYTYSLIHQGFFLNGTLAIGPAHNWLSYQREDGTEKNDIRFNAYIAARLSLGYNGDRFFGGLTFMNSGRNAKFDAVEMTNANSSFKIIMGYRFREFGFLRHRVWDLPKLLMN